MPTPRLAGRGAPEFARVPPARVVVVAPGAAVDQEVGDLLDGINQIEADQDEDLSQGKRLYTLGELVVVEVKVQETVHLCVK